MSLIKNLSVGRKLYVAFGLVVALLFVVAGVAYWGSSQLSSAEHVITSVANPKVSASDDVKFGAADLNGWQTAYVLDRGKSRGSFVKSRTVFEAAVAHLKQ